MHVHQTVLSTVLTLVLAAPGLTLPLKGEDASTARLTFVKVFKGSQPEYIRIRVEENGQATCQGGRAEEPDEPESLQLSPELTAQLFSLAAELNFFQHLDLDSGQRVAYMGTKTFIYQRGGQRNEVSYNYTQNPTADRLSALFEGIARGRYLIQQLEHRLIFDRLGLMEILSLFERDFNAGRLVDVEQFTPVLQKIADDPRLMQLARSRARELLGRAQGAPANLQLEYGDQESGWYYKLVLVRRGSITFEARPFAEPPNPRLLALPGPVVQRLWELAELANHFSDLTAYRELAGRLRGYRFTYQSGTTQHQVAFATPPNAVVGEMVHLIQQILQQEYYRDRLRAALAKESLLLQVVLQELEAAVRANKLLDPREFAPALEEIANGEAHHALVRERARRLLALIRARGT